MTRRRIHHSMTFLGLCAALCGALSSEPAHAQVSDVFHNDPPIFLAHPQDAFMQRIEDHLLESSLNYVTAFVTIHTPGWVDNNFTAFAQVDLDSNLRGNASYVFSDRLGYPWGAVVELPTVPGGFGGGRAAATMHFDPYQAEGSQLSIDLGYSEDGGVVLGLWGMELTDYTINPNDNMIFGYINGNPDWLAVVSVRLDRHPTPPH